VSKPFLVMEGLAPRWELFRLLGAQWQATRWGWLSVAWWMALGCTVALAARLRAGESGWPVDGLAWGAVMMLSNFLHSFGHVVAGRAVASPVRAVLTTSTRDVIVYERPGETESPRRRVGRALGGPAANLAAGCALLLAGGLARASWARAAGVINVVVGLWTLMPVPSLDGWVIWRSLAHSARERS
jgi:Zn-dependent protease